MNRHSHENLAEERILRALLFMAVISAMILYPLIKMGELYGENALYYQSLFELSSTYEDQSRLAQGVCTASYLFAGVVLTFLSPGAMKIALATASSWSTLASDLR